LTDGERSDVIQLTVIDRLLVDSDHDVAHLELIALPGRKPRNNLFHERLGGAGLPL
jgi:hypothetical protein